MVKTKKSNHISKTLYDYGSPGKVFLLDEKSMEGYLERLERDSKNFVFNRGAGGLRQITKLNQVSKSTFN